MRGGYPVIVWKRGLEDLLAIKDAPGELATAKMLLLANFGSEDEAITWLTTPKIALGRKRPLQVIGSPEGCRQVIGLLETLYD